MTDLLPVLPAFLLAVLVVSATPRVHARIEAVSGTVLLGLGARVALEPRA
ncbi:MAG: hypothetical protein ACFCVF_08340 [Kineosporiaceae bacterium]